MVTVQATSSVYVNGQNSTTQAKNYSSAATFRAGTSPQIISYLYFNRPFPLGATITDAYIEITQSQPTTDGTRVWTCGGSTRSGNTPRSTTTTDPV